MTKSIYLISLLLLLALIFVACGVVQPDDGATSRPVVPETDNTTSNITLIGKIEKSQAISEKSDSANDAQISDTGPTEAQQQLLDNLPDNGPAPELLNEVFLNSDQLRLADLRGQVVIVEFWTYG